MANTNIQLRKSGVSGNVPTSLAYGELALNYADGKLYYKNASGDITYISGGSTTNSFGTINANSSLIISTSNTDILSLAAANNITITGDGINKVVTIGALLSNSLTLTNPQIGASALAVSNLYSIVQGVSSLATLADQEAIMAADVARNAYNQANAAFNQANSGISLAQAAYNYANTLGGVGETIDVWARTAANGANGLAQGAFNQANTNSSGIVYLQSINDTQNSQISVIQGVDSWQNNQITSVSQFTQSSYNQANTATNLAQAAFNTANTAYSNSLYLEGVNNSQNTNIGILQGINAWQNTQITNVNIFAGAAFDRANNNTDHIILIEGVDTKQNADIIAVNQYAASAYAQANVTVGVDVTQNNRISAVEFLAQFARDTANNAVSNTNIQAGVNETQNTRLTAIENTNNSQEIRLDYIDTINALQNTSIGIIQSVNASQNTRLDGIDGVNATQNTSISVLGDINLTQNTRLNSIETINNNQNTSISIIQSVDATQNTRLDGLEGVNLTQNNSISYLQSINDSQNSSISVIQGIDATQNTRLNSIETINTNQNTSISIIQGVDNTQNTRLDGIEGVNVTQNNNIIAVNQYAASAYAKANSGGLFTGNVTVGQDLYVTGNLFVSGNTTSFSATDLIINDPIIYVGNNNTGNIWDIGLVGNFNNGVYQHTGIVRRASDNQWKLFSNVVAEPTNTVDFTYAVYDDLRLGTLTGNVIANTVVVNGIDLRSVQTTQNTNITSVNQYAASAYDLANNIVGVNLTQNTNITAVNSYAASGYALANTNATNITAVNGYAASGYALANTNATNITAVNNYAASGYALANTNSTNISIIQGVDAWQNSQITYVNQFAAAAYNKANAGISSSNTFITVNANSTLINASSNTDVLTIMPGNNISIVTDAVNKKLTISTNISTASIPTLAPTRTTFTAASAQSSIAITHTTPYVYVSINGITVDPSEYTANGTHVVLVTPLRIGDIVDVTGYTTGSSTVAAIKGDKGADFTSNTVMYVSDLYATGVVNIGATQIYNSGSDLTVIGVLDIKANTALGQLSLKDAYDTARYANTVNATQNTRLIAVEVVANNANIVANAAMANTIFLQTINNLQNNRINYTDTIDLLQNTNITLADSKAQAAFDKANTGLPSTGGTISGSLSVANNLTVSGNLTILGNATSISVTALEVTDPLIVLGIGNYTTDAVDIGFVGHYNSGANAHTGLIRDPNRKEYIFFEGYTPELGANNLINIAHPSFAYSNTYANFFKGNVIGTSVYTTGSMGVGTVPSGVVGEIRAANNITSFYTSDKQYKENIIDIPDALNKVDAIGGKLFDWTDSYLDNHGGVDGYFVRKNDFGVIAQDVQEVFPVAVRTKQDGSLAVDYEKLSALAFAAIKELKKEIDELKGKK